jgi:hypothetical protein
MTDRLECFIIIIDIKSKLSHNVEIISEPTKIKASKSFDRKDKKHTFKT